MKALIEALKHGPVTALVNCDFLGMSEVRRTVGAAFYQAGMAPQFRARGSTCRIDLVIGGTLYFQDLHSEPNETDRLYAGLIDYEVLAKMPDFGMRNDALERIRRLKEAGRFIEWQKIEPPEGAILLYSKHLYDEVQLYLGDLEHKTCWKLGWGRLPTDGSMKSLYAGYIPFSRLSPLGLKNLEKYRRRNLISEWR